MTLSVRECCPFFIHVMCDVPVKRRSGNGVIEPGLFLQVMRRPSFCLDVRFGLPKLTSQLGIGEIAGVILLACNFTDARLIGFNSPHASW